MARGHAVRGMVTAWLGLIALQAVSTRNGSGRLAGAFADADRLVKRVMDPNVPAIPDRRSGAIATAASSSPATVGAGAAAAAHPAGLSHLVASGAASAAAWRPTP